MVYGNESISRFIKSIREKDNKTFNLTLVTLASGISVLAWSSGQVGRDWLLALLLLPRGRDQVCPFYLGLEKVAQGHCLVQTQEGQLPSTSV